MNLMDWRRKLDCETPLALKDKCFLAGLAFVIVGFVVALLSVILEGTHITIVPAGIAFTTFPILLILAACAFVLALGAMITMMIVT